VGHQVDGARHPDVVGDVLVHEGEAGAAEEVLDVGGRPGDEVVEHHHFVAPLQ